MTTPIAIPTQRIEPAEATPVARTEAAAAPKAARESEPERQPSTRLLIEDVDGVFVYTVVDRASGHVIVRIPRERVESLSQAEDYTAGAMVDTQA